MPSRQVTIQGVLTWDEPAPPGIWGGGNVPMPTPPIYLPPTPPPVAGWGPGFPTNPIAPGGPVGPPDWGISIPPGYWPGTPPPRPQPTPPPVAGWGPGFPTNPIAPGGPVGPPPWGLPLPPVAGWGPGFPTNPIAPGGPVGPPPWGISVPPGIWGPTDPRPDNSLPGDQPGVAPPLFPSNPISGGGWIIGWSPSHGWVMVPVGGGNPSGPGGGTSGPPPGVDNTLPATEPEPK